LSNVEDLTEVIVSFLKTTTRTSGVEPDLKQGHQRFGYMVPESLVGLKINRQQEVVIDILQLPPDNQTLWSAYCRQAFPFRKDKSLNVECVIGLGFPGVK
jgi:hypothetical protein